MNHSRKFEWEKFTTIFWFSYLGSLIAGIVTISTAGANGGFWNPIYVLMLPALIPFLIVTFSCAVLISPIAYWCLYDKKLGKVVFKIYLIISILIWLFNLLLDYIKCDVIANLYIPLLLLFTVALLIIFKFFSKDLVSNKKVEKEMFNQQ